MKPPVTFGGRGQYDQAYLKCKPKEQLFLKRKAKKSHEYAGANDVYGQLEENYFQGKKSKLTVYIICIYSLGLPSQLHQIA